MSTIKTAIALAALFAFASPVSAQTTAPASKAPTAAAATAKPSKPQRTAKSLDCSKQADAKNIHGKERRRFMNTCKKG